MAGRVSARFFSIRIGDGYRPMLLGVSSKYKTRCSVPDLPNSHGFFVLLLTGFTFYLFTRERLLLEASGLMILVVLTLAFELSPYSANGKTLSPLTFLTGFEHEALVTICALMILGKSLETTGALQPLATFLAKTLGGKTTAS